MEKIIILIIMLSAQTIYSQAIDGLIIPNGDFEMLHACPSSVGDIDFAKDWHNGGFTPDLFSTCTNGQDNGLSIPNTYVGSEHTLSGNCYAGLVLFTNRPELPDRKSFLITESIWTKLSSQISPGKMYKLSLWIALADSSTFFTNYLTTELSDMPFGDINNKENSHRQFLTLFVDKTLSNKSWMYISITFIPDRNWNYLSIGLSRDVFFFKEYILWLRKNKLNNSNKLFGDCYYYLDKIELTELHN